MLADFRCTTARLLLDSRQKCRYDGGVGETPKVSSSAPLRVGIVGAGFIGAAHARAARQAGARVMGIVASSPASTVEAVAAVHAERVFESAEELITSADVDVVHVCTPN